MKIYNKNKFVYGLVSVGLGLFNIVTSVNTAFDVMGVILIVVLFAFGIELIIHSISRKFTKEDKLEELDERNQFIELKTKSKSFRLTQGISFGLMLVLLMAGKVSGEKSLIAVGVGLAFAYAISMFAEVAATFYYESHI